MQGGRAVVTRALTYRTRSRSAICPFPKRRSAAQSSATWPLTVMPSCDVFVEALTRPKPAAVEKNRCVALIAAAQFGIFGGQRRKSHVRLQWHGLALCARQISRQGVTGRRAHNVAVATSRRMLALSLSFFCHVRGCHERRA